MRKVRISTEQLLRWADELRTAGLLKEEEYDLLRRYLNYHDWDKDDYEPLQTQKYYDFYFPLRYKPNKSDYIRIVLGWAREWKRYWEEKREEEMRRLERERRLAIELAPLRDRIAKDFENRYGNVVNEFETRIDKLGLDEESPVVQRIADMKWLVYKRPHMLMSEEEVEKLVMEIEELVKKINKELDRLEEWEREWQSLSPEERKSRAEDALERFRKAIFEV